MQHDFFATRITDHPQPPYLTADHHRHTPPARPAHGEENCEITDVNLWRSPRGTVEQTTLNQLQPPGRLEVSDDHLNRDLTPPRRIPVKRTGFSQPEEIVCRYLERPFSPQTFPHQTGKILQPPLRTVEQQRFQRHGRSGKQHPGVPVPEKAYVCWNAHARQGDEQHESPGSQTPGADRAACGNRTHDLFITSESLCRLS